MKRFSVQANLKYKPWRIASLSAQTTINQLRIEPLPGEGLIVSDEVAALDETDAKKLLLNQIQLIASYIWTIGVGTTIEDMKVREIEEPAQTPVLSAARVR